MRKHAVINVNIEQEYNNYIRKSWGKLAHIVTDALEFHQKRGRVSNHEDMSNAVSQSSMRFLEYKLRCLELDGL